MKDYLIDTHAHINMLSDMEAAINDATRNNVKKIIIPSAYPEDIDKIYGITASHSNTFGLLGVHPSEARDWSDELIDKIIKLSKSSKIVGIGEIGLDYYWDRSFNEIQKEVFIKQLKLANELNLPVCIHDREAHQDTYEILTKYNKNSPIVLHCYSGSTEFAQKCIKNGWYIAIGGVVTFKNAIKIKGVAANIPLKSILLETDSPYLTPVPYRGQENQPSYINYVAKEIAKIRNISVEEVIQTTTETAERIFQI